IQGGLTGALFREFAFTLAGAVIVSGIVALTLSPMMGSRLLRAGDAERGFAGWINRRFDRVRDGYTRALASTLRHRGSVYLVWAVVVLLVVPFYLFSARELAPAEDQGVVFGVVQASANSTLDQTKLYASRVENVYRSFPEYKNTFQLMSATGGFGGMVTKPRDHRKSTTHQKQKQAAPGAPPHPRGPGASPRAPPLARGGGVSPEAG